MCLILPCCCCSHNSVNVVSLQITGGGKIVKCSLSCSVKSVEWQIKAMLLWMNRSNTGCSSKRLGILSNTRPKGKVEYYFKNEWTFYPCIVFHLFKVKPQWQQAKQGVPHVLLAGCTSSSSRGGSHCIPRPDKISLSLPFWVYCRLSYQLGVRGKSPKGGAQEAS